MNFLQPSPEPPLQGWMLASPQGQAGAAAQGWSFPGLSTQLREVLTCPRTGPSNAGMGEANHSDVLVSGG